MKSIRIVVNNIELDYELKDLTLNVENNSLLENFKVPHATHPIRIIENENAILALGGLAINSSGKSKIIDCKVFIGSSLYPAQLIQKSVIAGFRVCNIRFGSSILAIKDKKISEFIENFNVLGNDPEDQPYIEESETRQNFNAWVRWNEIAKERVYSIFPQVEWQLPLLLHRDRYFEKRSELDRDDTFFAYRNKVNNRTSRGDLEVNFFFINSIDDVRTTNQNAIAPKVFLLAPLFNAYESIGYRVYGDFVEDPLVRRILLDSENDNMVTVPITLPPEYLFINPVPYYGYLDPGPGNNTSQYVNRWFTYIFRKDIENPRNGSFILNYRFLVSPGSHPLALFGLQLYINDQFVEDEFYDHRGGEYTGSIEFEIEDGDRLFFLWHSIDNKLPIEYSLEVVDNQDPKEFIDAHPTIDFSRYLPDWTFIEYQNKLKSFFNLKFDIDDVARSVKISYNNDFLSSGEQLNVDGFYITGFNNIEKESYIVKAADNQSNYYKVSKEGKILNEAKDDDTEVITTAFKTYDHNQTSVITNAQLELDGEGLFIYDPESAPNTSKEVFGRNLSFTGEGSIYNHNWEQWIKFRINAAEVKVKKAMTPTEVINISRTFKIYANNQSFVVKKIKYKETLSGLLDTELELFSINY